MAADEAGVRDACGTPSQLEVENAKMTVLQHSLPRARQTTNVSTRTMCLEADCLAVLRRGVKASQMPPFRYPEAVSAIHSLAAARPKGFTAEPYFSAQLNAASSLPLRKDQNNFSRSRLLGLGSYEGGRLWVESLVNTEPPPCAVNSWQKPLYGEYIDVKDRWV